MHKDPTPYLGGVAIALAAASCSLVLPSWKGDATIIVAAALLVGALGLVDDVRTVRPSIRLVVETLAALAAVSAGARVQLFGDVPDIALTILWIVVITNTFNLLDNMDGAVGSMVPTIAAALAATALLEGQVLVGGMAIVVAAACLGFLLYNWSPASIFMGDAGSLFLGFLLAVISLKLRTGRPNSKRGSRGAPRRTRGVRHRLGCHLPQEHREAELHRRDRPHLAPPVPARLPTHRGRVPHISGTAAPSALGLLVAEEVLPGNPGVAIALAVIPASLAFVYLLRIGVYATDDGGGRNRLLKRGPTGDVI